MAQCVPSRNVCCQGSLLHLQWLLGQTPVLHCHSQSLHQGTTHIHLPGHSSPSPVPPARPCISVLWLGSICHLLCYWAKPLHSTHLWHPFLSQGSLSQLSGQLLPHHHTSPSGILATVDIPSGDHLFLLVAIGPPFQLATHSVTTSMLQALPSLPLNFKECIIHDEYIDFSKILYMDINACYMLVDISATIDMQVINCQ